MSEKTVLLDVHTAGASGDMFLSAILDLISDDDALVPVAASLLLYDPTVRVNIEQVSASDISGKKLNITFDKNLRFSPESLEAAIKSVAEELELSESATRFSLKALGELLQAESRAHDIPIKDLQLHETGCIDTVLDIVGTAYLLEKADLLGNARFLCTPVAVGSGTIKTEHGEMEVPVPAVAEILVAHDVPYVKGNVTTEILTPTGAALIVTLVDEFVDSWDDFEIQQQGIGFGHRDLGETPNILRLLVGTPGETMRTTAQPQIKPGRPPKVKEPLLATPKGDTIFQTEDNLLLESWKADDVVVIEANVDDVDGEVIGNIFDTLLSEEHAYDVVMIPAFGKKNRPCYIIKVIAPSDNFTRVSEILVRHLGTLGVRYTTWHRLKAAREIIVCRLEIDEKEYMVRVKVSRGPDGSIINIKPEADDLQKVSAETGIPIRELKPRVALQAYAVTE